jgi:hypothetical protein
VPYVRWRTWLLTLSVFCLLQNNIAVAVAMSKIETIMADGNSVIEGEGVGFLEE